jgi:segregation and condensation protein B
MRLTQMIEALLFASDAPLSAADLLRIDEQLDEDTVEAVIQELRAEYELGERSFQVYEVAGGYQLLTRPEFMSVLERYDSVPQPARLSAAALEVLAIIAYRQPIGRAEIEDIRGVGSSGVLRTLQERELVDAVARGEGLGRPLLYGTTRKFLEHFGFRSLEDLPRPEELPVVLRERTAPPPVVVSAAEAVAAGPETSETAADGLESVPESADTVAAAAPVPLAEQVTEAEQQPATEQVEPAAATGPRLVTERELDAGVASARAGAVSAEPTLSEPLRLPLAVTESASPVKERDHTVVIMPLPLAASPPGRAATEADAEVSAPAAQPGKVSGGGRGDPEGDEPELSEVGGRAPGV